MFPKAILFDLDDTIITFDSVADFAWSNVCDIYFEHCGLSNSKELLKTISRTRKWFWSNKERNRIGRKKLKETRREIVNISLERIGIVDPPLAFKIADSYSKQRENLIQFIPGAKETLEFFKSIDISLALITNGGAEYQRNKVTKFDLEKLFDVILIEGEIGYGKPDKEVYTMALKALRLKPINVWAVGDNLEWDVWGPQQLGICSIWNDYKKRGLPHTSKVIPDRIVNSITELI